MINQALVTAARRGRPIKDFVKGIIFLGTPHGGSSLALAGKLQALGTYWLGSRTELLELLEPHSKQNKQLHEDYLEYLEAHQGVYHYDFWENMSEKWWGFPIGMVCAKPLRTFYLASWHCPTLNYFHLFSSVGRQQGCINNTWKAQRATYLYSSAPEQI
jgi:hypothetical protein